LPLADGLGAIFRPYPLGAASHSYVDTSCPRPSVRMVCCLLQTAELFERMADRVERRLRAAAD
jgi:hypothetical protein